MSSFGNVYLKSLVKRVINIVVTWNVVLLCIFGTFVFFGILGAILLADTVASDDAIESTYTAIHGDGSNELLSIPIHGVITGTDPGLPSLFSDLDSQTAGYSVKERLYAAAEDELIKGVILEIDSPGGTIYGSHAIADGVEYYRSKAKKPVYAHISGAGASGAYWAAVATDKVLVDYGSDVGSIGVILGPIQYYNTPLSQNDGLLGGGIVTQNGIESVTITAGKSKDVGNPYRKLTAEEVSVLQKQVNNEYDDFVNYVSKRRNITPEMIRSSIGAMTYDQKTAKELGLSDGTMSRQDAYDALAKAAKISDDYVVVREEPVFGFFETLLMATGRKPQPQAKPVDLCKLSRASLAYHGDVTGWCQK